MPKARTSSAGYWKNPPRKLNKIAAAAFALCVWWGGGARAGGELRVLTWEAYLSPAVVSKFSQETGISVVVDEVSSYTQLIRPLTGGQSGYDIAFPADFQMDGLIRDGLVDKVGVDRLANFWNVDDIWRGRSFDPRNEYTVPHVWGTTAFVIDTAKYRGIAESLDLVFKPPRELAESMILVDSGYDMVQLALVWLKLPRCSAKESDLAKARELLIPMVKRVPVAQAGEIVNLAASGKYALAVMWNGDALNARKKRPSLRYVNPREGSLVWSDVLAVPKNAPNRNNALTFLSFMMRPDVAAMESNYNGYANMIRGAESYMNPELLNAPEIIAPPSSSLDFFTHCGNDSESRQEMEWENIKRAAGKGSAD